MWIVAKYNSKGLEVFKKELSGKLNKDIKYYHPKIKVKDTSKVKKFKYILGQYIFCQSSKFLNKKIFNGIKNLRGLDYFLKDCFNCQNEIIKFIDFCKSNEDLDGSLKRSFFNISLHKKYQFISGPFKNMIFNIISNNQKRFEIILNGKRVFVERNYNNLLSID
tara:strand:- start:1111 stop:1602 length:492 start_codon:yes stop_codon:yes gene_type:complete